VHAWGEMNNNCGKMTWEGTMGRRFIWRDTIFCANMFCFAIIEVEIGIYRV
jgi:hypothetical protein